MSVYDTYNQALGGALQRNRAAATRAEEERDQFAQNLPDYQNRQVGAASDLAKNRLANDLQASRQNANSRGMLYSGVRQNAEAMDRARASGQLAGNIQGINQRAQGQLDERGQQAVNARQIAAGNEASFGGFLGDQAMTNYEQALNEQKNQNDFFSSIFGTVGNIVGKGVGMLTGGGGGK